MNACSPRRSRTGRSSGPTTSGRITTASTAASTSPSSPLLAAERRDRDRQPERDEHDDLRQRRERVVEDLGLRLERRADVGDEEAGDEDGEEAGAVRDRGDAVDQAALRERAQRVEPRVGSESRRISRAEGEPARDPDREADAHLERELADDDPEGRVRVGRELDHADHQRDPDRVVRARLAQRGSSRCGRRPPGRRAPRTSRRGRSARARRRAGRRRSS